MDFANPELGLVRGGGGGGGGFRPRGWSPLDRLGRMVFLDLEMTGLDASRHRILEVAAVLTDSDLNEQARINIVLHQSPATLSAMPPWCQRQHRQRGPDGSPSLLEHVRLSHVLEGGADELLSRFLDEHRAPGTVFTLAGSSVDHDRQFLLRWMPHAAARLHYRVVDVSTLLELQKRWMPQLRAGLPRAAGGHRAMGDTLDSLALLRHYRRVLLHPGASAPAPAPAPAPASETETAASAPDSGAGVPPASTLASIPPDRAADCGGAGEPVAYGIPAALFQRVA
jgi:oligoribonuclease